MYMLLHSVYCVKNTRRNRQSSVKPKRFFSVGTANRDTRSNLVEWILTMYGMPLVKGFQRKKKIGKVNNIEMSVDKPK